MGNSMILFNTKNSKINFLLFLLFTDALKYDLEYITIDLLLLRLLQQDSNITKFFFFNFFHFTSLNNLSQKDFCDFLQQEIKIKSTSKSPPSSILEIKLAPSLRSFLFNLELIGSKDNLIITYKDILLEVLSTSRAQDLILLFLTSTQKQF